MGEIIKTEVESYDPRFDALVDSDAALVRIDSSSSHTEGPVYLPAEDAVIWSDTVRNRVFQLKNDIVSVYREPSQYQNGNAVDLEGRIVACSHCDRAVVRQEKDGRWQILVDHYQGKKLNSPNDLAVKSDGTIWFTDPPFGINHPQEGCGGEQEQPGSYVYRFDPSTNEIDAVITDMPRPNGIAFSPDEALLYVSDTSAVGQNPEDYHHIKVYTLDEGRYAKDGSVFAVVSPGQPDGFCVDQQGNVFTSSEDSVQVFSPEGVLLGKIKIPELCANLTFGGPDYNRLFITAGKSLYSISVKTKGN
ncbi:MAG: SMP-30/gluconolactonase/LRE family protein [Cyanobacteria bacterium J06632_3]